jgi:hypothetical protein
MAVVAVLGAHLIGAHSIWIRFALLTLLGPALAFVLGLSALLWAIFFIPLLLWFGHRYRKSGSKMALALFTLAWWSCGYFLAGAAWI